MIRFPLLVYLSEKRKPVTESQKVMEWGDYLIIKSVVFQNCITNYSPS